MTKITRLSRWSRLAGALALGLILAGCQADELGYGPKASRSVTRATEAQLNKVGAAVTSPVLMRIFKEENAFEVWKKNREGKYVLIKQYEICKWSGKLGPKVKEGDRQAPEGYYMITPALMNPNSQYYLAFNTGFPNAYDRANGRTGSALMVHGSCSSRGCYAMTDAQIQEIYALARDAFRGGQKAFQLQAYPFRMTPENMARHWNDPNMPFWKMLKEGYDTFELTRQEPKVDVCGRQYVFNATPNGPMSAADACPELIKPPELHNAVMAKAKADEEKAAVLFAQLETERQQAAQREVDIALSREEAEKAAAARKAALGSLVATVVPGVDAPAEAIAPEGPPVAGPAPRANPQGPQPGAMALVEEPKPASGGLFGSLFSSDAPEPATPAPGLPAPVATGPAGEVPAASQPSGVATQPATAAVPLAPGAMAPETCLTTPDPSRPDLPVCAPAVEEKPKGLIGSLGSLF